MSICVRGGQRYKRHWWNNDEVQRCMVCGELSAYGKEKYQELKEVKEEPTNENPTST